MNRFFIYVFSCFALCTFMSCKNRDQNYSISKNIDNQVQKSVEKKKTDFEEVISSINIIELPFSFYCGVDSYVLVEEYNSKIINLAPKEPGVGIIGRLPSKENKEYIIYGIIGDIIYPYLYIYDKNGVQLDSLYLHIGPCIGDELMEISNKTIINEDYSINMLDTTRYRHYNYDEEENKHIMTIDSIFITKRDLKLNEENFYIFADESRYELNPCLP